MHNKITPTKPQVLLKTQPKNRKQKQKPTQVPPQKRNLSTNSPVNASS